MNLKTTLSILLGAFLVTDVSAMTLANCTNHIHVSTASIVVETSGEVYASEANETCGDESRYWTEVLRHWALYQQLSTPDSSARPNFTGDWILNIKVSDDPLEKAREAIRASRQSRGGGSSGMIGRGGGKGGGMVRGGMGSRGQGHQGMYGSGTLSSGELPALFVPAHELHIKHKEPLLQITNENDQRERIFTDFRGGSISTNGGMQQRVSVAGWEGAVLVVETTMLEKKLTQSYQINEETGQLVISSSALVSATQPVSYRLVYDRRSLEAEVKQLLHEAIGEQG